MTSRPDRARSIEALEEAMDGLLHEYEVNAEKASTSYERRQRRRALLRAARRYGRAMDALARGPRG